MAYVAAGLRIVDLRSPGSPALLGGIETPGEAAAVAVEDGHAYVADGGRGLLVIDVTDPLAPVLAGSYDTPGSARGLAISGGYAFVADDFRGLEILDVRSPSVPRLAGNYDTPGRAVDVAVGGGFAYVADLNRGLQILDVRDPASPTLVREVSTPGAAAGVALSADRLFVADGFSGLLEIDVGDPARPVLAGVYDTPGVAADVAFASGLAYVADGRHGLQIVRPGPAVPRPMEVTAESLTVALPAGFAPGPYDVQVTQPDETTLVLPDGFFVCPRRVLGARLVPADSADRAVPGAAPALRFSVELSGDDAFFTPAPRHRARLLLPTLPAQVEARYARGTPGIELRLGPGPGAATALLFGPDPQGAARLWEEIRSAAGIDLPRLDDRRYGEMRLSVLADPEGPVGQAAPRGSPTPAAGRGTGDTGAPLRYRYEFEAGRLVEARAWGPGTALVFAASAMDPDGCETETRVTFNGP